MAKLWLGAVILVLSFMQLVAPVAVAPVQAATTNSSTFMFKNAQTFSSPNYDMTQGYTPAGTGTSCGAGPACLPAALGNNWTNTWASDTFASSQSMASGTATVNLFAENNVSTISFVAPMSQFTGKGTGTSCGWDATAQNGEIVICVVAVTGGTGLTINGTNNYNLGLSWNFIRRTDNGTGITLMWWWRQMVCAPGCGTGGAGVSWGVQQQWTIVSLRYSGVDTTSPINAENGQAQTTQTPSTPTITPNVPNTMIVTAFAQATTSTNAWSPPTGMNERTDFASTNSGTHASQDTADVVQATATAVSKQVVSAPANAAAAAHILALKPAARTAALTVKLLQGQTLATASLLASTTVNVVSPMASPPASSVAASLSLGSAVNFADNDRLFVQVVAPSDPTNINARVWFDGSSKQSDLVTPTISQCSAPATTVSPGQPGWVAAQAQSTQATVYWSSAASVMVIEKPATSGVFVAGDYPTNGSTWLNNTTIGTNGAYVRYVGPAATSINRTGLTNNTTYYYQVFPYAGAGAAICYATAPANAATARPSSTSQEKWSYMLAGGAASKPPIAGDDGIFFSSNASQLTALNSSTGLWNWTGGPVATTSAVQGWVVPVPLSAGGSRLFAGDQGGKVYAVDTAAGATPTPAWQVALTGATAIQAGASVQLRAYSSGLPGAGYDLVYVATKNGSASTNNKVFALRSDTGAVVWTFNDGSVGNTWSMGEINGMPAVDYSRNRLYVTSLSTSGTGASVWVLDTTTGQLVGNPAACPTANSACVNLGDIDTSPNISLFDGGNTLWVGNKAGLVYALNLAQVPGASMLKWTAAVNLGTNNQLKGLVWEDFSTAGRLYMVVANTTTANNSVRCFLDPGVGGTPNNATACSGWPTATINGITAATVTVNGAQAALPLDKLYVTAWDGATGRIQQIDFNTGAVGTAFTLGDGLKQPGDVSTDLGTELFVGTTEGKIFKISLPIPP